MIKSSDAPRAVSNKSPNHLFQKRLVDFETNLKKDLENSFKVLETKELPLKITKMEIVDKPERAQIVDEYLEKKKGIVIVTSAYIKELGKKEILFSAK